MIEQHITRLIEDLHLPPIPKDPSGAFSIPLQPDVSVSITDLSPGCLLRSVLGPIPETNREELFTYVMKANFLGQGTGEQTIGIDPEEKFLTLSRIIPYEINYPKFKEILEEFVNYLLYWKEEIRKK